MVGTQKQLDYVKVFPQAPVERELYMKNTQRGRFTKKIFM